MVAGAALLSAAPAQAATRTAHLFDDYFTPVSLTVKPGTTIMWRWPSFMEAGDVHDVKLKSGPKGVKRFHSEAAAMDFSFKRKLTVPGTYKIICTLHEGMRQTIRVR